MLTKSFFLIGIFILSIILTVIMGFGLSFLIVPHHPVDPYQLMQEATRAGERLTTDWWDEVYIPEKHHERFAILGKKREVVFNILFLVLLPIVFFGCWLVFIRRRWLHCKTTAAQI